MAIFIKRENILTIKKCRNVMARGQTIHSKKREQQRTKSMFRLQKKGKTDMC